MPTGFRCCSLSWDWRCSLFRSDIDNLHLTKEVCDYMNCPYCSREMEKGYIDQTDFRFPLEWYPANRETGFFVSKKRTVRLTYGGHVTAYRCEGCRKIMIDESTRGT